MEFINGTDLSFADISSEAYREYTFLKDGTTHIVKIDGPLKLNTSKNGHRIFDAYGRSHYIPNGWVHLTWHVKKGQPHFVK